LPTFSQWRFDFASAKKLILFGLPFVLSSVVGFLLSIDIVMIKWLKDAELVGQYSVGSRIISLLFIIPAVFTTSLYPIFSKFYQDKEKLLNILRSSTSYMLMLALPLFLGGLLLAHRLVIGFFGSQYNLGVLSFKILLLSIPLYFLIVMLDYLLIALNYQVKNMLYTSVAAIVNVILAFLLIAKFSIYGAAIATVTARLINLALTYRLARKILGGNSIEFEAVARFALAAMVMTAFLFFINPIQISTLAIMLLAMILYFLALFVLQERNFLYLINVLRKVHLHT
jgi:O-antigen/teichoic acid export membrane protein